LGPGLIIALGIEDAQSPFMAISRLDVVINLFPV
jgi:hypothetical protein